jgi:hypothetical protein
VAVAAGVDGAPTYTVNANPLVVGSSGNRFFFVDQSGVITFNSAAAAGPADQPVQ